MGEKRAFIVSKQTRTEMKTSFICVGETTEHTVDTSIPISGLRMGGWVFVETTEDIRVFTIFECGLVVSSINVVERIELSDARLIFELEDRKYNLADFIGRIVRGGDEPAGVPVAYAVLHHTNGVPCYVELCPSSGRALRVYLENPVTLECE